MEQLDRLDTLVQIMDRLREPGGCPWDREQTYETLRRYLVEESFEVADAIDRRDLEDLREELGDLLFQVVFLCRLSAEQGRFTVHDVIRGIADKMIRRHPHVFGTTTVATSEEVVRNWEEIKRREKGGRKGPLDGIAPGLPALLKAQQLGERAARAGFDWTTPLDIVDKLGEETEELRSAVASGDRDAVQDELGDVLFTLAMIARRLAVDAEGALARANEKFRRRFTWMAQELERRGLAVEQADAGLLESLWMRAKHEWPSG
jgi:MazG family protein